MGRYRERRPPIVLEPVVACLWWNDALVDRPQRVVPDGCVDLVWLGDGQLVVVGADTGPVLWQPVGAPTCGIRLRPGAAGEVLGVPASEVLDRRVPLAELWPDARALADALASVEAADRPRLLARAVLGRRTAPDPLVVAAARRLAVHQPRIATVAADLGVSERHLHRRWAAAVGYGPKTFARVARLRRLVALPDGPLAERALSAGYASQAHMTDEVRRLTGITPVRFLEDAALTAA